MLLRPRSVLTGYDEQHLITYLRLLDADAEGADWREVARIVLHLDPSQTIRASQGNLGLPPGPRPLDDREWLPASAARWSTALTRFLAEAATRVAVCECRQSGDSSIYFGVNVGNKTDGDAMARGDWTSPAAYEELGSLDAPGFAWEYLDRNPDFTQDRRRLERADRRGVLESSRGGRVRPALGVAISRQAPGGGGSALWTPAALPSVITLTAAAD